MPGANQDKGDPSNLLEVARGPLDQLVTPTLKKSESFDGSKDVELLKVAGKPVVLKIAR